jgi:signal transduction histidine kinase
MKKRIEETGGQFRFEHREGQGAVTVFEDIPLENTTKV